MNNQQTNFQVKVFDVALVTDFSGILASGDIISNPVELVINGKYPTGGLRGEITSIVLHDKDNEGAALDLYFLDENQSLGTLNAAPNITDANSEKIFGVQAVATGDYKTLATGTIARPTLGQPIPFTALLGSIWIAAVSRGTPTYTAATDLRLRIGIRLFNAGF
jgi:hypothetical protein